MRTHRDDCSAQTREVLDFVDITDDVQATVGDCGINDGQVTISCACSSCVLIVNERETGLLDDIRRATARLAAPGAAERYPLLGTSSVVVPAVAGRLRLGMWQRLLLVELERPDTRKIVVQIVGE